MPAGLVGGRRSTEKRAWWCRDRGRNGCRRSGRPFCGAWRQRWGKCRSAGGNRNHEVLDLLVGDCKGRADILRLPGEPAALASARSNDDIVFIAIIEGKGRAKGNWNLVVILELAGFGGFWHKDSPLERYLGREILGILTEIFGFGF